MKTTRFTDRRRLEELRQFVNLCFAAIDESDLKEVANRTHLSISTLRRIQTDQLTLAVHFGTIQLLGIAAGLRLELTPYKANVQLINS